jgi:hypothetical protein
MKKLLIALAALLVPAGMGAVDQTTTENFDLIVGGHTKDIDLSVSQTIARHVEASDTLTNGRGWVYLDFPRKANGEGILKADVWILWLDCDSCFATGVDVGEVRLVSGTDSLEYYVQGYLPIFQPADSTATDLIQRIAIKNPHADTTATGSTATFTYSFFKGD